MSTSDSRTNAAKALLASVLIGTIVIVGSVIFITRDAEPIPRTAASAERAAHKPAPREDPIAWVRSTATNFRTAGLPPEQASFADGSLSAIHEDASALAVKLSHLSSSQAQTEARIQEIATKFLGSPVEVPSYEQQQERMGQFRSEAVRQRHIVEKYEKEAVTLAREHGIPESAVLSGTLGEVQRHTAGRSIPDLIKAQTYVIYNRKILEAAEKRYKELSQIQTLPPKT